MTVKTPEGTGITRIEQVSDDRNTWPLSPCVMICTLDDDDRCVGCGRTVEQIGRWAVMSKDEQWAVIDSLADWTPDED